MAGLQPVGDAGREAIGVGMLGYAFMGKAHASAYRGVGHLREAPPLVPELVGIAGRDETAVREAAERYGFASYTTDWHDLVDDPRIALFDNGGPNDMHAEPTIAAARAGKHVFCEKPLARDAPEAHGMWAAVAATGVQHMCAFNYRFVPAVRLAREVLESGDLGEIVHFRARYLQDWLAGPDRPDTWRMTKASAGSGALGDLGTHIVDLARYLVGEPAAVGGLLRHFGPGGADAVDDAFEATVEFEGGAIGTLEASRVATGRKNGLALEINGTRGSLAFDLERLNELQLHGGAASSRGTGFARVLVTDPGHPFLRHWWPPGHVIGWEHSFVHEIRHLIGAIAGENAIAPHGATFEDGYRAVEVCDAIARASESGRREEVRYRALDAAG